MTYKFVDTNEAAFKSYASIQTIVNGTNLDTYLDGFRTLNVSGRSIIARDIETLQYSSKNNAGSKATRANKANLQANKFISSTVQNVIIEVEFLLTAPNNELFRKHLTWLTKNLLEEESKWAWTDDPFYYYVGTLTEMGKVTEDSNTYKSSFKIVCVDPMKYSKQSKTIKGSGSKIQMPKTSDVIEILNIKLVPKRATNKIMLVNYTQELRVILDYNFKAGNVINFAPDKDVKISGINGMTALNLISDKEDFNAQSEEVISLNTECDYEIEYRFRSF